MMIKSVMILDWPLLQRAIRPSAVTKDRLRPIPLEACGNQVTHFGLDLGVILTLGLDPARVCKAVPLGGSQEQPVVERVRA